MRNIILLMAFVSFTAQSQDKFFQIRNPYQGSHYAFSSFDAAEINQFIVQFNETWNEDISDGFDLYDGNELGMTFSTSGMRFVWGKKDMKWTASTDYAIGFGKTKNEVSFRNGISQKMELRSTSNQINNTFGISLDENKFWFEGLYCTNIRRIFIEYSTVHLNDIESFGPEYKLNGLYKGLIRTMEFGAQASYRKKKYIMYARVQYPIAIVGPGKDERYFTDAQSKHANPTDFPSNYNTYVSDPQGHYERKEGLMTSGFKGLSYGFGIMMIIGKFEE